MLEFFKFWLIAAAIVVATYAVNDLSEFRVVGGYRPQNQTLVKHIVSLRLRDRENVLFGSGHFCGGSIISPNIILTAAHCIRNDYFPDGLTADRIIVNAGSPMRLIKEESTQICDVVNIRIHKEYKTTLFKKDINDIAILKLAKDIIEDGITAQRIPIASRKFDVGTICTAIGWGRILRDGPLPEEVGYVKQEILSKKKCSSMNKVAILKFLFLLKLDVMKLGKQHICIDDSSDIRPSEGICHGDSGGPLICDGTVVGINSYILNYCGDGPSIVTNVYYYRDWIESRAIYLSVDIKLLSIMATVWFAMNCW